MCFTPTFRYRTSLKLHEISFRVLTIIILFIQNKLKDKDSFYVLKLGKKKQKPMHETSVFYKLINGYLGF